MSYFDFPHTRNYDSDLSFLIEQYQTLLNKVEELIGKIDEGDVAKAYKEIGLMNKAMLDAREGMIQKMRVGKSGKTAM